MPKFGVWKTILLANFSAIVINGIKQILTTPTILIGRVLFGVCVGISNICLSKVLNDTIPSEVGQKYGMFQNGGITGGVFISNFLGALVPLYDGTPLSII